VGFRCVQSRVSVECITVLLSEAAGIIEPRASSRISELGTSDALGDAPRFFNSDPDPDPLRGRVSCKENNQLTKLITLIKEAVLSSEDASHLVFFTSIHVLHFPTRAQGPPLAHLPPSTRQSHELQNAVTSSRARPSPLSRGPKYSRHGAHT